MTAPYTRSYVIGDAVANHETGLVSAVAASVVGSGTTGGRGWIEVDHVLAEDASSIDYTVILTKNATVGFSFPSTSSEAPVFRVGAEAYVGSLRSEVTASFLPGPQILELTLSSPDGVLRKGSVVRVRVGVWAYASSCNPIFGCHIYTFAWAPTFAVAQAVVNSVVATTHGPEPTPTPTPSPTTSEIQLEAQGYKEQGLHKAELTWSGGSEDIALVDVYRDETVIATTENDGAFTDEIDQRGNGTYVYQVCEADTTNCSNEAVVEF